jgi:hypothetical protein
MSKTADAVRRGIQDVTGRYTALFAGQPRITRDARVLDQLVRDLEAMRPDLLGLPGTEREELTKTVTESVELYRKEAVSVRAAQSGGPEALAAHRLASWAYLTFARYRHHYAGQSRGTRDLALMGEMVADLEQLQVQMAAQQKRQESDELTQASNLLGEQLGLYREERKAIAQVRSDGDLAEQSDRYAALANGQMSLYGDQFAGKQRLSRRPMLLERIIDSLRQIGERMQALVTQGHKHENNQKNIGIVQERVRAYRKELEEIQKARASTDFPSLINALGAAANEVFKEYGEHFAGKDRATRELPRLAKLLDSLFDIGRQMDDLEQVRHDETNARNLQIVLDNLRMYDREFTNITEAKAAATGVSAS